MGVYGNGGALTGSLTAVVMGNVVSALPALAPVVATGDYDDFMNSTVQTAGLQNVVTLSVGQGDGACGTLQATGGTMVAECIWIDDETFCIVAFDPPITDGDVSGELNFAESDVLELRTAIDTA